MTGHDSANTSFNSGERTLSATSIRHLHLAWVFHRQVTGLIVGGGRVYAVTQTGIAMLDPRSGKQIRLFTSKNLGVSPGLMASGLAYSRGVLVLVSSQAIVAFKPSSGQVLWRRSVSFTTNITISGNVVYIGSYCFNGCPTYALDLRTGKQLWENPSGGLIQSVVAGRVFEGLLWQGHCQDRIIDQRTGSLIATLSSCGSWTGTSSRIYGLVFPPDVKQPASVEPVNGNGQRQRWQVRIGRPDSTAVVFAYGTLFAATAIPYVGLIALKASTGKILWRRKVSGTFHLLAANHLLFVLHRNGAWVDALQSATGRLLRRFRVSGAGQGSMLFGGLVAGGQLYTSAGSDTVVMRP
ncbi:MAG TPA: PQQ-binding-like beta-propeller repeat protein [Chloroflexota bacterium]